MDNEWIEHDGGPCPVGDDEIAFLKMRDGRESAGAVVAWAWRWSHNGTSNDIIAYRVVPS